MQPAPYFTRHLAQLLLNPYLPQLNPIYLFLSPFSQQAQAHTITPYKQYKKQQDKPLPQMQGSVLKTALQPQNKR
jgi:hypothetical protein